VERVSVAAPGARVGYTRPSMASLLRGFRAGTVAMFAAPAKPGPESAPAKDRARARARVVALRRLGLSVSEISSRLRAEATPLNRTGVGQILAEEGLRAAAARPRSPRPAPARGPPGVTRSCPGRRSSTSPRSPPAPTTSLAGLLLVVPDLVALDLPALVAQAGYPGTAAIPAVNQILSLLALTLTATRGVSPVEDLVSDPASALFAGGVGATEQVRAHRLLLPAGPRPPAALLGRAGPEDDRRGPDHRRGHHLRPRLPHGDAPGAPTRSWRSTTRPPSPSGPGRC